MPPVQDQPARANPNLRSYSGEVTYAQAVPELSVPWRAEEPPAPQLTILNADLALELGLDPSWLRTDGGIAWLTGQTEDQTFAQAYAGHQFGVFVPQLGDGRAVLLAELTDLNGLVRDLHLKGSGPTPFARAGDGKAVLGPMLREYVIGEFLHAVGIPSTRALAVLTTGESIWRDGEISPGAVLVRVATGLVRVGTFQLAARRGKDVLRNLADYAISRHHPQISDDAEPYLSLYRQVCGAQAALVADWMAVGFVHGVMNTDNMVIAGESMDFGPCAFLDTYDTRAVFSSIDHLGRYAYGNQPAIAQWNLARFGEALLPLIAEDPEDAVAPVTEILNEFAGMYAGEIRARMARKFGLTEPSPGHTPGGPVSHVAVGEKDAVPESARLVEDALVLMQQHRVDFTSFFRRLAAGTASDMFPADSGFGAWHLRWREAVTDSVTAEGRHANGNGSLSSGDQPPPAVRMNAARMNAVNPAYIPRNHVVDEVLANAVDGDLAPLERLVGALRTPFEERGELADLAEPPPSGSRPFVTFCGT